MTNEAENDHGQAGNTRSQTPMLAFSTIADLEQAASVLAVDEPESLLCEWLNLSAILVARAKEIRQRVEQLAVEWIKSNGPLQIGDIRYTAGIAKVVKCTDPGRCMTMVLDACQGDLDAVTTHLRSDPWKYGSIRSLVGGTAFEQVFTTESKPKLVEGKPRQELLTMNTRFAPGRSVSGSQTATEKAVD